LSPGNPLFDHLTKLRDDFRDEIPVEVLHSISPNNNYKVRRTWFQGVVADIELMMDKGLLVPTLKENAEQVISYFTSDKFHYQPLTLREDIDKANEVIDLILGRK